jgi:Fe-S cluster assembly protein SufB
VPQAVKRTFDRVGIPEAERKFLSGVGAQYESEVVYHQIHEDLEKQGVIFTDMDTALREHEELVRQYFATIIPPNDNKLAALNSAVWSGGSFVYVHEGVHVDMPLQAYFRINTENMGQFERTLIIAEPGSYVHYVEGCTPPTYSSDSLHSAVVELIALPGARIRYTTVQNCSTNVYNLAPSRTPMPRSSGSTATSAPS